jgi:hypothetical protein
MYFSSDTGGNRRCPYCSEFARIPATVCRRCHRELTGIDISTPPGFTDDSKGGYGLPICVLGFTIAGAVITRQSTAMYACLGATWMSWVLMTPGGTLFRVGGGLILTLGTAALIHAF